MVPEIDQQRFTEAYAAGALVLDVRDSGEYRAGRVPGARPVPLGLLPLKAAELPRERPVYVICRSGARSAQATALPRYLGYDARNVSGGTAAWVDAGRPVVTGLVGAGGGFLVVPAPALPGGLPMPVAVGTSLLVIAMKSTAGFAGYLTTVPVDWVLTAAVTSAAVAGGLAGAKLAGRVPAAALSRAFAWFALVMGTFTLLQQAPAGLRLPALAVLASLGTGAGLCYGLVARCPLRRAVHSS